MDPEKLLQLQRDLQEDALELAFAVRVVRERILSRKVVKPAQVDPLVSAIAQLRAHLASLEVEMGLDLLPGDTP
jgi:hypothetical protein